MECDGLPHTSTHTLVSTGQVSVGMDRDAAGNPTDYVVTVGQPAATTGTRG